MKLVLLITLAVAFAAGNSQAQSFGSSSSFEEVKIERVEITQAERSHALGLTPNARLTDWDAPTIRRRETFSEDGVPYAVFIARNGCAFGKRHSDVPQILRETGLLKPGEKLLVYKGNQFSGFYFVHHDTLVSSLNNQNKQEDVIISPVAREESRAANRNDASAEGIKRVLDSKHPLTEQHGPIYVFVKDKKLVSGDKGRHMVSSLAQGKVIHVIPSGMPAAGVFYTLQ